MGHAFFRISIFLTTIAAWTGGCAQPTATPVISEARLARPQPATLRALNLSPSSVTGGRPAHGMVFLTAAAPAPGILIELSTDDPAVNVPATVKVAGGATSAPFVTTTLPVGATTTAIISGKHEGVSKTVGLAVKPPLLTSISFNTPTVVGGSTTAATVQLDGDAPSGGIAVTLSSNRPSRASVPPSITIPAGRDSASFDVNTTSGEQAAATISASADAVTKAATVMIQRKKPQLSATSPLKSAASDERTKTRTLQIY